MRVIEIEGLRFGYGRQLLYDGFDLHVSKPGIHGLFGRNGSGKSTLFKLIAGLLFRHRGRIHVAGHDPENRHADFLARVYLVPEDFHLPNLSCERLARHQAVFYPDFSHDMFGEALATFELDAKESFERMSLGGRKKAVIAFALATRTPVLLLDEPTNGLDIVARDRFRELIRAPSQAGRIIFISTHQAHDLEQVISQVLFIENGCLALSAPMERLARALRMGIVDGKARTHVPDVIYEESIGSQIAFIASRGDVDADEPVQLELLYRALCRAPERVLSALSAVGEPGDV